MTRYSQIPAHKLDAWSDRDLADAIWDEGIQRMGGFGFKPEQVANLPQPYRAVIAEGLIRAFIDGDGIETTVWNDDGTPIFPLAAQTYRQAGCDEIANRLDEAHAAHQAWRLETGLTPRSLGHEEWVALGHAKALRAIESRFAHLLEDGFSAMMRAVRNGAYLDETSRG